MSTSELNGSQVGDQLTGPLSFLRPPYDGYCCSLRYGRPLNYRRPAKRAFRLDQVQSYTLSVALTMTLAEREKLRRVGRENSATAGVVCPAHVKATFNFEFEDIDIDVLLEELLVEASKETPRWHVMLTPLPGAVGELDSRPTRGRGDRVI